MINSIYEDITVERNMLRVISKTVSNFNRIIEYRNIHR